MAEWVTIDRSRQLETTYAMRMPNGVGCLVRVCSWVDGALSESVVFVPNVDVDDLLDD